jgi:hypothetical protein
MKTWISLTDFRKNLTYEIALAFRLVGAELFHANRHDEANSRFSQFCEPA